MRVLALGGAGEMGIEAVRVLAHSEKVEQVVIADRDGVAGQRAAKQIGGAVRAVQLDICEEAELAAALAGVDLVVNTVGPFDRFGPRALAAAIEAQVDYIDICDDPQPTVDMLEFDERARAAGVCAVIGVGASPGISNMLAMAAVGFLDTADEVLTGWNIAAAQPGPGRAGVSAAVLHGMAQIAGKIPVVRDGEVVAEDPLRVVEIDYPGVGRATARTFGHPEPITLHRALSGLTRSSNVVVADAVTMTALRGLRGLVNHTPLGIERTAWIAQRLERLKPSNPADLAGSLPPLFALASGSVNGEAGSVAVALAQVPGFTMAENTGIPLAVGALLVGAGRAPGVYTPETAFAPDEFFEHLAPHCIGWSAGAPMSVVTRSWASAEENRHALRSSLLTALSEV